MKTNRKIAYLGILTALYVILGAFMKIPVVGNIFPDFGYIAFAIAILMFGYAGIPVGVIGCALESLLFSTYGFSISWVIGNLLVGLIFAYWCKKEDNFGKMVGAGLACIVGIALAKTGIECWLYQIPVLIKMERNFTACIMDMLMMWAGIVIFNLKPFDNYRAHFC